MSRVTSSFVVFAPLVSMAVAAPLDPREVDITPPPSPLQRILTRTSTRSSLSLSRRSTGKIKITGPFGITVGSDGDTVRVEGPTMEDWDGEVVGDDSDAASDDDDDDDYYGFDGENLTRREDSIGGRRDKLRRLWDGIKRRMPGRKPEVDAW